MLEKHWAQRPKYEETRPLIEDVKAVLDAMDNKKAVEFREQIINFFTENKDMDCDALSAMSRKELGVKMVAHCGNQKLKGFAGIMSMNNIIAHSYDYVTYILT